MPRLIKVADYNHAQGLILRCRKPSEGKQIASWCRIYNNFGMVSFITDGGTEIGRLTQDNMFRFTLSWGSAVSVSPTLSRGLHKISNMSWIRDAKAKYSVSQRGTINNSDLFTGLQVAWVTGEIQNARKLDTKNVEPEARREWLRCLRDYKRGLAVRSKMGVLSSIIAGVVTERNNQTRYHWTQPDWFAPVWVDKLASAIRQQDFSLDLLKALVQTSDISYWNRQLSDADVLASFDKLTRDLSVQLRLRFGVFGDCDAVHSMQRKDEVFGNQSTGGQLDTTQVGVQCV